MTTDLPTPCAMRGDPDAFGFMFVDLELRSNSKLPAHIAGWENLYTESAIRAWLEQARSSAPAKEQV